MAVDLHIHILSGVTEEELALFNANTIGSKHFNPHSTGTPTDLCAKFANTPDIWVGEVSWLKAALMDAAEKYVPGIVVQVSDLIGEDLPVIDDALIAGITRAYGAGNTTGYKVNELSEVLAFLEQWRGQKVFTISW